MLFYQSVFKYSFPIELKRNLYVYFQISHLLVTTRIRERMVSNLFIHSYYFPD